MSFAFGSGHIRINKIRFSCGYGSSRLISGPVIFGSTRFDLVLVSGQVTRSGQFWISRYLIQWAFFYKKKPLVKNIRVEFGLLSDQLHGSHFRVDSGTISVIRVIWFGSLLPHLLEDKASWWDESSPYHNQDQGTIIQGPKCHIKSFTWK